MRVKLYIEGGGDSHLQDTLFREAWRTFFQKAGLTGKMPAIVRGGGRAQTFDAFRTAVRTLKADELPLLLVDSEEQVAAGDSAWAHLKRRDAWEKPETAGDNDAFLMVECMETWFLADRESLRRFFRDCWRESAFPQWSNLEAITKVRVFQALDQATSACGRKRYAKGKLSFDVLKSINPALVETSCPSAARLLQRLRNA